MPVTAVNPLSLGSHQNIVARPFDLHFNANESVCLNTGAAQFRTNIVSLPGRGGIGLTLDLLYSSSRADLRRLVFLGNQITTEERHDLHGLGVGWIFDLPYIFDDTLYIPGKGSYLLDGIKIIRFKICSYSTIPHFQAANFSPTVG